jgi:hypothetical protein
MLTKQIRLPKIEKAKSSKMGIEIELKINELLTNF